MFIFKVIDEDTNNDDVNNSRKFSTDDIRPQNSPSPVFINVLNGGGLTPHVRFDPVFVTSSRANSQSEPVYARVHGLPRNDTPREIPSIRRLSRDVAGLKLFAIRDDDVITVPNTADTLVSSAHRGGSRENVHLITGMDYCYYY